MWMMAISMKIVGWIAGPEAAKADWVLKLLPSCIGALGAIGVYLWGKRVRGEWFAFLATFVLLSSLRFAKYSKGFMLDAFLATFSVWAVYSACRARDSRRGLFFVFGSGVLVAAAFLSKGLFAFAPFAVVLVHLLAVGRDAPKRIALFLAGAVFPLALWFAFGGAGEYLSRYYVEHVAGRIGPHPFLDHLAPLLNLVKVYWPWLPFFFLGIWTLVRSLRTRRTFTELRGFLAQDETAMALTALAFLGGFMLVGSFLEQYHTATYPFAALVVAIGIPAKGENHRRTIEKSLLGLLVALSVFMLFAPFALRGHEYKNPVRILLQEARARCQDPSISRVVLSTGVAEIWYALAMGTWNTDWDARSDAPEKTPNEIESQILLAAKSDAVGPGWVATEIESADLRVYRSSAIQPCTP
jgi:4-amino-4-deoxy-L-arabinose transferase-like glycosyltransferase